MTPANDIDHTHRDDRLDRTGRLAPRRQRTRRGPGPRPGRREGTTHSGRLLAIAALSLLVLPIATPAHAYLDPGTGSMILQVILGGVAGLAVAGKLYWKRVKEFFGRSGSEATPGVRESTNDPTPD